MLERVRKWFSILEIGLHKANTLEDIFLIEKKTKPQSKDNNQSFNL